MYNNQIAFTGFTDLASLTHTDRFEAGHVPLQFPGNGTPPRALPQSISSNLAYGLPRIAPHQGLLPTMLLHGKTSRELVSEHLHADNDSLQFRIGRTTAPRPLPPQLQQQYSTPPWSSWTNGMVSELPDLLRLQHLRRQQQQQHRPPLPQHQDLQHTYHARPLPNQLHLQHLQQLELQRHREQQQQQQLQQQRPQEQQNQQQPQQQQHQKKSYHFPIGNRVLQEDSSRIQIQIQIQPPALTAIRHQEAAILRMDCSDAVQGVFATDTKHPGVAPAGARARRSRRTLAFTSTESAVAAAAAAVTADGVVRQCVLRQGVRTTPWNRKLLLRLLLAARTASSDSAPPALGGLTLSLPSSQLVQQQQQERLQLLQQQLPAPEPKELSPLQQQPQSPPLQQQPPAQAQPQLPHQQQEKQQRQLRPRRQAVPSAQSQQSVQQQQQEQQPQPQQQHEEPQESRPMGRTPAKKPTKRARVLREGQLSLIVYGYDEKVLWARRVGWFIRAMRGVLGDRTLRSRWGGSVVDSVVGTFLTQNAADVLSSAAFMNLVAAFPGPRSWAFFAANKAAGLAAASGSVTHAAMTGPVVPLLSSPHAASKCGPAGSPADPSPVTAFVTDESPSYSSYWIPEGEDIVDWEAVRTAPDEVVAELIRCRGMHQMLVRRIKAFLNQLHEGEPPAAAAAAAAKAEKSEATAATAAEAADTVVEDGMAKPSAKPAEVLSARAPSKKRRGAAASAAAVKTKVGGSDGGDAGSGAVASGGGGNGPVQEKRSRISLEWLRDVSAEEATKYLTSVDGLGRKSAACITLLTLYKKEFPVDINVARVFARLGWIPIEAEATLEQLDSYPQEPEVHKYLHSRLMAFDLETLYELHYQSITLGKVFCQKRAPNCDSCPLAPQCDYALQGGQRLKKHAVVLQPPQPPRESPLSPQHHQTQHPHRKPLKPPVAPADASTVSYASRTTTRLTKRSRSSMTHAGYAEGCDDEIMPPPAPPLQVMMAAAVAVPAAAAAAAAAQRQREVERLIAGLRGHSPAHDVSEAPTHAAAAGAADGADAVDGSFGASTAAITTIASNSAVTAAAPGCQLPAVSTASMSSLPSPPPPPPARMNVQLPKEVAAAAGGEVGLAGPSAAIAAIMEEDAPAVGDGGGLIIGAAMAAATAATQSVTVEAAVAEAKDAAMALPTPSYPRLGSSVRRTALPYAKVADAIIGNQVTTSTDDVGGSDAVPELTVAPMSEVDDAALPPPPPPLPPPPPPPATPLKLHKSRYEDGGSNVVRCISYGSTVQGSSGGELESASDAQMQVDVEVEGVKVEPTATEATATAAAGAAAAKAKATRVTSAVVPPVAVVTELSMTEELHVCEAAPPPPAPPPPLAPATPMRKHNTIYGGGGSGGGGIAESSRRQLEPRVGRTRFSCTTADSAAHIAEDVKRTTEPLAAVEAATAQQTETLDKAQKMVVKTADPWANGMTHGSMGWGAAADAVDSDGRTTTAVGDARCRGDRSDGANQRCVEGRGDGCDPMSLHATAVAEAPPPTPLPPPPPPPPTAATPLTQESIINRQRPSRHIRPPTRYAGHEFITLPVRRRSRREVNSNASGVRVSDDCHGGATAAATCTSHYSLRSPSASGDNANDTASEVAVAAAAAAERAMTAAAAMDVETVAAAGSNEGLRRPYCNELRPEATTGLSPTAAAAENAVAAAPAAAVTESAVVTAAAAAAPNVAVMTNGTVTADAASLLRSRTRVAPPPTPARLSKCSRTTAATAPCTASAAAEDAQRIAPEALLATGEFAAAPARDPAAVNVNVTTPTPTNPTEGSSVRTSWRHVDRILEILKRYEGTAASDRVEAGGGTGDVDLLHRRDGLPLAAALEILSTEAPALLADGAAAVRQRYLELSVAVHPDKCRHPRAADAFAVLTRALAVARRAADTAAAFKASCTTLTPESDILDNRIASSSPGAGGAAATTSATIAPLYVIEDDGTIRIPAAAKKPTMSTATPNSVVIRTSGHGNGTVIAHGQDLDPADLSRKRPHEDFHGGGNDPALNALATAVSVTATATSSAAAGPLCMTSQTVRLRGAISAPEIRTRRLVLGLKISDAVLRTIAPELPWPSSYGSEVRSLLRPPQPSTSLPPPPPHQQQQQQQQQQHQDHQPQALMDTENECMPYMIVLLEPLVVAPVPKSAVAAAMAAATAQCTAMASSLSVAPRASAPPDLPSATATASAGNATAVAGDHIKPVTARREPVARRQSSAAAAVTAAVTTVPVTATPAAAAAAISLERSWRVVAPEVAVLPALRRLIQLSAALAAAAAAAPAAERSVGHAEAQHDASVASAMEEEAAALCKTELRAAVLMPCRTALRGGFPLNGTYFQTNELFVVDHTAQQPLRFRLGQLLGTGAMLEPCLPLGSRQSSAAAALPAAAQAPVPAAPPLVSTAVYFGHATSSITRDMTAADVAVLFEEGAVCVRGFCTFSGSPRPLPTFLGSPSSLGHAGGRRAQSRTDGGNRRRAIDAEIWEED